jgi:fido (protein-threonine AMPylation protein)
MQEPINVKDAYEFCLENTEFLRKTPENFIRKLHEIVLRDMASDCGQYRRIQVTISGMAHTPPDWTDVEPFMARLSEEIKNPDPKKSALQNAAEIHSKLTSIHPFSDGNGRTARLIMNAILLDSGLPGIVIAHSDKARYLDALASSNKGDISEFCMMFAESMEAAIEKMSGKTGSEEELEISAYAEPVVTHWIPSKSLAEIMRSRIERSSIDRKNRYDAWAAAFDSLREDFRATCLGFNEEYGEGLYYATLSEFDRLPFEKYEDLLRQKPVPKTWLMGLEIGSDRQSEKFVFWFRHMSPAFQKGCESAHPPMVVPPRDVTLGVSRRMEGTFQPLNNEPIQLREMAYIKGEWFALLSQEGKSFTVAPLNAVKSSELFLIDAISAFL